MSVLRWRSLAAPPAELRIDVTLACGQSFRWKKTGDNEWSSVLGGRLISLQQTADDVLFADRTVSEPASAAATSMSMDSHDNGATDAAGAAAAGASSATKASVLLQSSIAPTMTNSTDVKPMLDDTLGDMLRRYFWLDVKLEPLYASWAASDPRFKYISQRLPGVRILRQDPTENLFSFICSSNNNISRITLMIDRMCQQYGVKRGDIDGQSFFDFPEVSALAQDGVEERLRELGFGYRAKFIEQAAKQVLKLGGSEWLLQQRALPYVTARTNLVQLQGVGPKVADCICLMSMDKHDAIPVDVHVRRLAERDYKLKLAVGESKTMTAAAHDQVGNFFRKLWGEYAGWAHSVMFSGELKRFEDRVAGEPSASAETDTKPRKANNSRKVEEGVTVKLESKPDILNAPLPRSKRAADKEMAESASQSAPPPVRHAAKKARMQMKK
ncbi:DNA N-glycosylase [Capsaspora owczarzaki ATCC 30864]|uniref:N-glycosylase/DNA lyase n=1 Tax=Capsaspora owczarzaki (strain ATCC 30864) TaxID=595528 RepID=A0A0D2UR80_CAPO3|nr:DNA N-glycosylase [Capsaspora owczarzaki ATCC 30864]KJE97506.1 DNA N-glycosylase [Capsaspora owczarzaki ATCC 30864]|eukprot:XP_004343212.1 DNA N-glycosylase [Capsaspora owczarzaki ATCC 30864]